MPAAKPKPKTKTLDFANKLVLNQWLLSLLGIDPLAEHKHNGHRLRPFHVLAQTLRDAPEGIGEDGLHRFYHQLADWHRPDAGLPDRLSEAALLRYEENIVAHTQWLNTDRERPIEWKYYQWLALLFVEVYLHQYFGDRDKLLERLNAFIDRFNTHWQDAGWQTGITPYGADELNKLCLQCATGSGKTLLMHVNFRQFAHYAEQAGQADSIARTLLITPNEGLSAQHEQELRASGIDVGRLVMDNNDLFASQAGRLERIDYIEITKLGDRDGDKTIATRNLGDENLILVDEGHHGLKSSADEKGWYAQRERLTEKGFTFEYSATFKEALANARDERITEAYAKAVLFDYSYRWFYEDGYGKDYRIFNIPRQQADHEFVYLTACLLGFYQQLRLYQEEKSTFAPYTLEKPLWVFVGSTVSKPTGNRDEKATVSDIVRVLRFVARFLADPALARQTIDTLLEGNAKTTGLVDENGKDIFHGSFLYLRKQQRAGEDAQALHGDLLARVFNNRAGGKLHVLRIKGEGGELLLKAGTGEAHFGLINVGEARELARHIEAQCGADPDFPIIADESDFEQAQFATVTQSSSPIHLLVGAKKFIEGWDCWRVSTLGLMNVGQSEGSQIIQLFGRGVRLKGRDWTLKRSSALVGKAPEYISYLETLNVFGVNAQFMKEFKEYLSKEDLPGNDHKQAYEIPMNLTYDFGHQLRVLRPRRKDGKQREYQFNRDGIMPLFGDVPTYLEKNRVQVDWYPRIAAIVSDGARQQAGSQRHEAWFTDAQIAFLDIDRLYFELEQYKARENLYSLIVRKAQITPLLRNHGWYVLFVPEQLMAQDSYTNVRIWNQIALELLKRYCRKYFEYCADAFIRPRLETRVLTPEDANLPQADEHYRIVVDASEAQLIADIETLQADIKKASAGLDKPLHSGRLKASLLANHLYQPLLYVEKGTAITVSPVALNDSEMAFVSDLTDWLQDNQGQLQADGTRLYLLRNQSRGKGIGFFEAGNFYPDFILWLANGQKQTVVFVEPHGMTHEGPEHAKVQFHNTIKDVEKRLGDSRTRLESFIVTPTRFAAMKDRGLTQAAWADRHVLFMTEYGNGADPHYLTRMFQAIAA